MNYGVQTYRKKPVTVTALLWTGANFADMERFLGTAKAGWFDDKGTLRIHTVAGTVRAIPGDYVGHSDVTGGFELYSPRLFEATYERVETEAPPTSVMHHPV